MFIRQLKQIHRYAFRKHPRVALGVLCLLLISYLFCLPSPLFQEPLSTVLEDRHGDLLGARIADDGQWRFPTIDSVPDKFAAAIIEYEDRRFYRHPGIDLLAIGRAVIQNIRNGRIVSGGSTLTMQVIRLARGDRRRTLGAKAIEAVMATRLELGRSKKAILALYASHAPFGGNVVGLEAASWRYYGKRPELLSWSEAATLAVLPNSPALIHPGRNRSALHEKRNRLLDRLLETGHLDSLDWQLARAEALPEAPLPLPRLAPHLLERARIEHSSKRFRSSLNRTLQQQLNHVVSQHHRQLRHREIHNIAAIIIDVETGQVLAYTGNAPDAGIDHAQSVDIITAPRSTGSILKPFLYALMLQERQLTPFSLVPDVPGTINGFRPENFNKQYEGAVPANRALIRSLNVPMVYMLQNYGLEKFHFALRRLGFSTISQPADHYGLTLILGGAEATLWDIAGAYAGMSRTLKNFYPLNGQYAATGFHSLSYLLSEPVDRDADAPLLKEAPILNAASIWFTFEAMQQLERPDSEGAWEQLSSSRRIAWKTGTSYGFRDAWAIGITPQFVVGVWVGNADGEGRPGLIGVKAAAPVLFDAIDLLPSGPWFAPPYDEMTRRKICSQSGYPALPICPSDSVWTNAKGPETPSCTYHRIVHLTADGNWQVDSDCEIPANMEHLPWFVLPPLEEFYYKRNHPAYRPLPPKRPDCSGDQSGVNSSMQLIYPRYPTRIFVPVDLDGALQSTIFEVAHRRPDVTIYWHLDNEYLGSTTTFHKMELNPPAGTHLLTLVDENGARLQQQFEIIESDKRSE